MGSQTAGLVGPLPNEPHTRRVSLSLNLSLSLPRGQARFQSTQSGYPSKNSFLSQKNSFTRGTLTSAVILRLRYCGKYCNYCGKSNSKFGRKNSDEKFLRPCRPQFYVHVDLNFRSMSTSIIRPCRPQSYVQFDLNYTTVPCNNFFLPTVRSWGDMELPLATIAKGSLALD